MAWTSLQTAATLPPEYLGALIDDRWETLTNEVSDDGTGGWDVAIYNKLWDLAARMVQGLHGYNGAGDSPPERIYGRERDALDHVAAELSEVIEARIKRFAIEVETERLKDIASKEVAA